MTVLLKSSISFYECVNRNLHTNKLLNSYFTKYNNEIKKNEIKEFRSAHHFWTSQIFDSKEDKLGTGFDEILLDDK